MHAVLVQVELRICIMHAVMMQVEEISSEAFYERNSEFTAWLKEEKGIFFTDLPSSEARQLFDVFVGKDEPLVEK